MSDTRWSALRRAPRELFVMFVTNMLIYYSHSAVSLVFVLFLTEQHGYTDSEATALYGWLIVSTMIASTLATPLIERIGIRQSLVLGALIAGIGMVMTAASLERAAMLVAVLCVLPLGMALGMPIPLLGGQRYSFKGNRELAFPILYACMNLGAFFAGLVYNSLRVYGAMHQPLMLNNTPLSAERLLILSAAMVVCFAGLFVALLVRPIIVRADGTVFQGAIAAQEPRSLRWIWDNTVKKRVFWQVVLFAASFAFVKQIYRQFDMILSKWALRVLGPDAPIGLFYGINPLLIVVMAPVSAVVLSRFNPYTMQIVGSAFSAFALFFLSGDASELLVICTMALFTVGESMYSPQTSAIILAMAPESLQATYSVLATLPIYASAFATAWMSGALLDNYCSMPITGGAEGLREAMHRCGLMWVWIAAVALVTPVLLILLRCFIYTPEIRNRIDIALKRITDENDNEIEVRGVSV